MAKTIGILGASSNRDKFGNKAVRAYKQAGWDVYPINPRAESIEGLPAYGTLEDVPVDLNRVNVYLPPALTLELLPEIHRKGGETFFNPGSAGPEVFQAATALGIDFQDACSIVDIGLSPSMFP